MRDRASYVLEQSDIRFVVTSGLRGDSEIARFQCRHGDGVKDVAFAVPSAADGVPGGGRAGRARRRRAVHWVEDEHGRVELATIETYGETVHSFVNREGYAGAYLPGYTASATNGKRDGVGLRSIDHVVGNVELGRMEHWVEFYERVIGMTELLPLLRRGDPHGVLGADVQGDAGGEGKIKLPINEPAEGKRKSQIEEYLEFHEGPGVQHIALQSDDIVGTVDELRRRGVVFLGTPEAYYEDATERVGEIGEDWATCGGSGSSPIATTRVTCCRSSRRTHRTGRPSSSR